MAKIVYDEKCIVEALSKEGKRFSREISLTAKEISRQTIDDLKLIKVDIDFKNGKRQEKETILTSDLTIIRDYFLRKICAAIDLIPPEKRLKVTFPPGNKYLKMRRAYCQNCGKFLEEFYGFYEGRVKECPHCKRQTIYKRTSR